MSRRVESWAVFAMLPGGLVLVADSVLTREWTRGAVVALLVLVLFVVRLRSTRRTAD